MRGGLAAADLGGVGRAVLGLDAVLNAASLAFLTPAMLAAALSAGSNATDVPSTVVSNRAIAAGQNAASV